MSTPTTTKPSSFASRLKAFGVVFAALTTHSGQATNLLARRQAAVLAAGRETTPEPVLEAGEDATYRPLFDHLAGELKTAKDEMISANADHLGQLARIIDLKGRRDALTGTLSGRFFKARHTYETLFGSDKRFAMLAIAGDTPTDPTALVAQVRDSVVFLEEPKVATPELDLLGIDLEPQATAAQLTADADELDGTLADVNQAEKQAEVTREAKNAAIKGYDRKFLRVARVAESVFHFAGLHELATRVRPSTRRPGRRLADEAGEPDAPETSAPETEAPETGTSPVEATTDTTPESDVPPVSG